MWKNSQELQKKRRATHSVIKYVDAETLVALIRTLFFSSFFLSFQHVFFARSLLLSHSADFCGVHSAAERCSCGRHYMCEYSNILMFDVFMVFTDRYLRNFTITSNIFCVKYRCPGSGHLYALQLFNHFSNVVSICRPRRPRTAPHSMRSEVVK